MQAKDPVLVRAEFDRRLPIYFMLNAQAVLFFSVISIPVMPLWWLFGRRFHRRQYESLRCELTARTLNVRRGVLLRVQQSIPLDKITDLALHEGPILRHFGLCSLSIETAGGGQPGTTGQARLPGLVGAEAFRDRVLAQRDAVVLDGRANGHGAVDPRVQPTPAVEVAANQGLLVEIRDILVRIESALERRS